jgi:hypothetical protein
MKFKLLVITVFAGKLACSQSQFSGWFANFSSFKLNNKFSIHFDGQLRSTDDLEHVSTLLLRTGLNAHVKKNMIATAGYAFIHNRRVISDISGYAPEHRLWQQFIVSHPIAGITLNHRFRLEQRFITKSVIENYTFKNEGNIFANRFRYFFRGLIPIGGKLGPGTPFVAVQNEVFLNFGDKSGVNGEYFDQNRAYLAFGLRLSKEFDLEAGYMNQYINGRNEAFTNNHIAQLATYLRL